MAAFSRWSDLRTGSANKMSPSKIINGVPNLTTMAFNNAFVYGTSGNCFAGWFLAQETGTLTDVWVYVASYNGTWGSTDGVINGQIREGMASTFVPGTLVGSAFTITLNGTTANCWVKKSGLSISVTAGKLYSFVIGDQDGGATNYVTMNRDNGVSSPLASSANGSYSASGFNPATNQFTGTMMIVKYAGLLHPLGTLLDEMVTTTGDVNERGLRFKPDEDVVWVGMGGYPDSGVTCNEGHIWKIYPDSSLPKGTTLGTYTNQAGSLGGSAPVPLVNVFSTASHLFLPAGRWYRFTMLPAFAFSIPRKIRHLTTATIDADVQAAALAFNGNCYWTEEVIGSPGSWTDDVRAIGNISPVFIPAAGYSARPSFNLGL